MTPPRARTLHTFVASDFHLSDAQPVDSKRPLWKRFKGRDLFVDDSFARFLDHIRELGEGELELVLNGDALDFDSVMKIPDDPEFEVRWLERKRGLDAEVAKSVFKTSVILEDHSSFIQALRTFLMDGHRVVFVVGNHDLELHWPEVQAEIRRCLDLPEARQHALRFCEWFYLSDEDTLIEHGNQYDSYCLCTDPVHPLVHSRGRDIVRLPFGNLAGKYMLNGMGLFNPHVESSYIRSLRQYVSFSWRYMSRVQPWIGWSWFWTAMVTLIVTLREGFLPALRDPFTLDDRVEAIAERANTTPRVVRALMALRVHPAVFNPFQLARELWLDRAMLLGLVVFGTFQLFSFLHVFVALSLWWWVAFFVLLLPPVIFYARSVNSDVANYERGLHQRLPEAARLAGVKRAVMGHTHIEKHTGIGGVEMLNTGTWSPAYRDVECTEPHGRKCFAWLRPTPEGRVAELREWQDPGSKVIPRVAPSAPPPASMPERLHLTPRLDSEVE